MRWLIKLVDEIEARQPEGEILIESGASPSGTYHMGHLREILTCDAVLLELRRRGREASHVQFADDLDALRKIPVNIPVEYEQYLGKPLCDIPSPSGEGSYGDYFLSGFIESAKILGIEMDVIYSHEKYRSGYFVPAVERVLSRLPEARNALETISGRQLDEHWSPIQVMDENGYLKNRTFVSIDTGSKTLTYRDREGVEGTAKYDDGSVKLDWRLDWPGRWWLMKVGVEPFGRDHASAGGSFDTGVQIMKDVYEAPAPLPVPYDFINRAGDTKKMSASKGTGIAADEAVKVLPPEVLRYFVLSAEPSKRLYFDQADGAIRLVDEYAALSARDDLNEDEQHTLFICNRGSAERVVSRVPFSHLVASYQAALKDPEATIEIMKRTEHADVVEADREIIKNELKFIDAWLEKWAPEDVKFTLQDSVDAGQFSDTEKQYFNALADKISAAPAEADGEWFHKAIYEFKEELGLQPKDLFVSLYRLIIGKDSGPRAGWFLSLLPRDWLITRLRLEK